MTENNGWVCPTCKTVWSPTVKSCEKCTVDEGTENTSQLLLEKEESPYRDYLREHWSIFRR